MDLFAIFQPKWQPESDETAETHSGHDKHTDDEGSLKPRHRELISVVGD